MTAVKISIFSGLIGTAIGLITFILHWNFFDIIGGPLPGYQFLLFPARMTLIYFWHPLFTEEISLLPKLAMMLVGQFTLVSSSAYLLAKLYRR